MITAEVAAEALDLLEVDSAGLDRHDRTILETIAVKFAGGPVGLSTLAAAVDEEQETIEDVYEPYLLQQGLIKRTPRGRVADRARLRAPRRCRCPSAPQRSSRAGRLLGSGPSLGFRACRSSSARTAGTASSRGERTGSQPAPEGCSKCGAPFLFELLDDYYPAPDAAFFICDQDGAAARRRPRRLRAHRAEGRGGDRPARSREVLGLEWIDEGDGGETADTDSDGNTDPIETTLEWGVRSLGKRVAVNAEGDLPGRGRRRRLPRLRRRRRAAARAHPAVGSRPMGKRRRNLIILALRARACSRVSLYVIATKETVLGLDLQRRHRARLPGPADPAGTRGHAEDIDRAIEIIRERVDALGVSEPEISRIGADQIQVGLPERLRTPSARSSRSATTAQLYFYDFEPNVIPPTPEIADPRGRARTTASTTRSRPPPSSPRCSESSASSRAAPRAATPTTSSTRNTLELLGGPVARQGGPVRRTPPTAKQPRGHQGHRRCRRARSSLEDRPDDDPATEDIDESRRGRRSSSSSTTARRSPATTSPTRSRDPTSPTSRTSPSTSPTRAARRSRSVTARHRPARARRLLRRDGPARAAITAERRRPVLGLVRDRPRRRDRLAADHQLRREPGRHRRPHRRPDLRQLRQPPGGPGPGRVPEDRRAADRARR